MKRDDGKWMWNYSVCSTELQLSHSPLPRNDAMNQAATLPFLSPFLMGSESMAKLRIIVSHSDKAGTEGCFMRTIASVYEDNAQVHLVRDSSRIETIVVLPPQGYLKGSIGKRYCVEAGALHQAWRKLDRHRMKE